MRRASLLLLSVTCLFLTICASAHAQQRPAITGIAFVRMYTADAPASAAFYGKTLGYGHADDKGITRYSVNDLQWLEVEPLPAPAPASRLAAVAFTTRDAATLERYLKAHQVAIVQPLAHGAFAVHDPEGNLRLLRSRGDQGSRPPHPCAECTFSSHHPHGLPCPGCCSRRPLL